MSGHFTFFASYYDAVEHLDAEIKAEFFDVLFKYALRDEEPESMTPVVNALFTMAKPNLDISKKRRAAGRKGGSRKQDSSKPEAKVKQTGSKPEAKPKQTKTCLNESVSDKDKDKDKDKDMDKDIKSKSVATTTRKPVLVNKSAAKVSDYLLSKIVLHKPNFIRKGDWTKDIDLAMRVDKRTEEQLIGCIDWIYSSSDGAFWIPNILSGKKLREKFDTMEAQMMRSQAATSKVAANIDLVERIYNEG